MENGPNNYPNIDLVNQLQSQLNQLKQQISENAGQLESANKTISDQEIQLMEASKLMVEQEEYLASAEKRTRITNEIKSKLLETVIAELENEKQLRKVKELKSENLRASLKSIYFEITNVIEPLRNRDATEKDKSQNPISSESEQDVLMLPSWMNMRMENLFQSRSDLYRNLEESNKKFENLVKFVDKNRSLPFLKVSNTSALFISESSVSPFEAVLSTSQGQSDSSLEQSPSPSTQSFWKSSVIDSRSNRTNDQKNTPFCTVTAEAALMNGCSESGDGNSQSEDSSVSKDITSEHLPNFRHEKDPTDTRGRGCTCGHKSVNRSALSVHIRRCNTQPKFHCTKCDSIFVYCSELKHHYKSVHKITLEASNGCRRCGYTFKTRSELILHQRRKHGLWKFPHLEDEHQQQEVVQKTVIDKRLCDEKLQRVIHKPKVKVLKRHGRDQSAPRGQFRCICQRNYKFLSSLLSHIRSKLSPHVFKCPLCAKSFNNHACLKSHVSHFHKRNYGNKKFGCHTCGQTFQTLNHLRLHRERNHSIGKSKKCETCPNHTLRRNKIIATSSQLAEPKLSSSRNNLKHGFSPLDARSLRCICGKVYGTRKVLRRHIIAKTTVPKFSCTKCTKSFVFGSALKVHYLSAHKTVWSFTVGCTICGEILADNADLMAHRKAEHSSNWTYETRLTEVPLCQPDSNAMNILDSEFTEEKI